MLGGMLKEAVIAGMMMVLMNFIAGKVEKKKQIICFIAYVILWLVLNFTIRTVLLNYIIKLAIAFAYLIIIYHKNILWCLSISFVSLTFCEIISMFIVLANAFVFGLILQVEVITWREQTVRFLSYLISLLFLIHFWPKKLGEFLHNISTKNRIGILLFSVLFMSADMIFSSLSYTPEVVQAYEISTVVIIVSSLILLVWLLDKQNYKERMSVLSIQSGSGKNDVMDKLDQLSDHVSDTDKIIKELYSTYNKDNKKVRKEFNSLKTFESTNSIILDEKLEEFLIAAVHEYYELEVIVKAPITETINCNIALQYQLVQFIEEVYESSQKAVSQNDHKIILFSFGYNSNGYYEISIHDNGERASAYDIEKLSKYNLLKSKCSLIINHKLRTSGIFNSGIFIVFDQLQRMEVC